MEKKKFFFLLGVVLIFVLFLAFCQKSVFFLKSQSSLKFQDNIPKEEKVISPEEKSQPVLTEDKEEKAVTANNKKEKKKEEQKIEVIDGLLIIRQLDKEFIKKSLQLGKEFLFKAEDKERHGFHKYYFLEADTFNEQLHTPYTASIIYTFLFIYDYDKDNKILSYLKDWGDFLLSMQNKNKENYGAFSYSLDLKTGEKEKRFPVGTSALSIFTLLRLYEFTHNPKYLNSAKLAGDWLLTMIKSNGMVKPYVRYDREEGIWVAGKKESLLYEGQTLSALSKLYCATKEKKYLEGARKIAERFFSKYEKAQGYVQGEYRKKNPISNCWVVMSLLDFYKASGEEKYKKVVFELSSLVLKNQITDKEDIYNFGRIKGAYSSSGNGWISEVMTDVYHFCQEEKRQDCQKYKDSAIKVMRWVLQHTIMEENASFFKNPQRAVGGIFWNRENRAYVRTDTVCHALNAYAKILKDLPEGILLSL